MQRVGTTRRRGSARLVRVAASGVALATLLAACTNSSSSGGSGKQTPADHHSSSGSSAPANTDAPSSSAPAGPLSISISPATDRKAINPAEPISVKVADGTLTSVTLTNPAGKKVKGTTSSDGASWQSAEDLGYSRTYKLAVAARDADGRTTVKHEKFTTVTPNNMTLPYINTIYGSSIQNNGTYGVGMVVSVKFDEQIPDKQAAMKALQVTTSPHVDGAWYWLDNSTAHWRPQHFYAPGTKVTVNANVYGKNLGGGLYGQSDESISFTIGEKRYSVANAETHQVKVFINDKLVRTMPTSMGRGGYVQGKYGQISLWTMNGYYTVINHENPATMSSDSYGLPANSPAGYAPEKVPFATKISIDGIYLHELDATVWAQGHQNLSHGCLNLNYTNAKWYFEHSTVGDVVKVVHSGGSPIRVDQGGDWSVPWATWAKGGDV